MAQKRRASPALPEQVVLIVDDDLEYRRAVARLLATAGIQSEQYGSAAELRKRLSPDLCGCMLLDMVLPDGDGVDLLPEISQRSPVLAPVVVTGFGEIPQAVRAIRRGAFDFIEKPLAGPALIEVVRASLENSRFRSIRNSRLTAREQDVLDRLMAGSTVKSVALALNLSVKTVYTHRDRIFRKLGVSGMAELRNSVERVS